MFPFVSAQFLREISLLSNPSKAGTWQGERKQSRA